jgi:phosphohistidine swiveling domain-containing protein
MRSLPGTDHSDPDCVVATKIQQDVVQLLTVTSNLIREENGLASFAL